MFFIFIIFLFIAYIFMSTNITVFSFLLLPRYRSLTAEFIEVKPVYFAVLSVIKVVLKMDDLWVETS